MTAEELSRVFGLSKGAAQLLALRMESWPEATIEAATKFLNPSLKDLPSPFLLKDMDRAVERVIAAIKAKEKIAVYGDYDVDGTCAAALLRRFFSLLGFAPHMYQPDRVREGYGLHKEAVGTLSSLGIKLLITVDCGISNAAEVAEAKRLGVDVIVCDHHQVPPAMPEAVAVLNHKRLDDESPIKTLCGAGMAFYLAMGVRAKLREQNWFSENDVEEPDLRQLLDLVALASVADLVPLLAETRVLTHFGIQKMRFQPNVGIRALCEQAGIDPQVIDTYHLGFLLGPRINASGRLDSASHALELLSTDDPVEAERLAKKLDNFNKDRIELTSDTFTAAEQKAREWIASQGEAVEAIVIAGEDWHEGVIGIVASRLQEAFKRPALIVTYKTHSGLGKGSARAGGSKLHLANALQDCRDCLVKFGGHQAAAGLSVEREKFPSFALRFIKAVRAQLSQEPAETVEIRHDLLLPDFNQVDFGFVNELMRFSPFGMDNPEPVLLARALTLEQYKVLKEKHLKLSVQDRTGKQMGGFWPNGASHEAWKTGDTVDILFSPQINEFRGKKALEMRIRSMQK